MKPSMKVHLPKVQRPTGWMVSALSHQGPLEWQQQARKVPSSDFWVQPLSHVWMEQTKFKVH